MSHTENWRTQINAVDYFGQQKKQVAIEQRRPTIRKASDLVGPGIGAEAVRIDDYNNLLATFNGYYASAVGAANAPNNVEAFVGTVISDAEFGGRQVFTGLTSGTEYSRTFTRSPTDPETIGWGLWSGQRILPSVSGYTFNSTLVPNLSMTILVPPLLNSIGESGIYEPGDSGIRIRKQGVYSAVIQVGSSYGVGAMANVVIQRPNGTVTTAITHSSVPLGPTVDFPLTVWASDDNQGFAVLIYHSLGATPGFWWRFLCTRLGDAV